MTVVNGPIGFIFAFGAGILSFLSPCTLPLLPGYLAYMSGLSAEEVKEREHAGTVFLAAALFVLGFSLVFVAYGATLSYFGHEVALHKDTLTRAAGVFIIVMGLVMLGLLRVPALSIEKRMRVRRELGVWSAFPLGVAFGFSWSPCIGPILGAVLAAAATVGSTQRGTVLLFVYALGLGLPFLLTAVFAQRMFRTFASVKRHYLAINRTSGAVLLVMGVFLILNRWTELLGPIMRWYSGLNLPS